MKMTESMLREMVETPLDAAGVGEALTMTGFELEEITVVEGEAVLDVNVMANRGDGASVLGLARELLAKDRSSRPTDLYKKLTSDWSYEDIGGTDAGQTASLAIETPLCSRYAFRVFVGITNGPSPDWVQERLTKVGQRPISLLVDLTNYVMLETGQPLHAFDLDRLAGPGIVVREARRGESLTTLDEQDRALQPGDVLICDLERPVALAGVMGGADTEVGPTTTRCLLESAHFDPQAVRRTRKRLGLHTEASYRFERWVDPAGVVRALDRFAELLEQATGARPVPGVASAGSSPPAAAPIRLRHSRLERLLGMPVPWAEAIAALERLGCQVEAGESELTAVPPSWRTDLVREDDLIEDVGRVYGYEKIPEALPIGSTGVGGPHGVLAAIDRFREELLRCGLDQTVSHTLRDVHTLDQDGPRTRVRNPHAPEMALMRNSMLPCLADAVARNAGQSVRLFEIGKAHRNPGRPEEAAQLGILLTEADVFELKGVLQRCCKVTGAPFEIGPSTDRRLHPTRQAAMGAFGVFGQMHPAVAEECDLPVTTVLAEVDLDRLLAVADPEVRYRPVHRHPAVRRDIAVVISKAVPYAEVERAVAEACGEDLERQWLFDVYSGPGIPEGSHSLGIAIQLRKAGTFTDEEANQVRDAAVAALERLGARLR
jgi:phenylalanyl-tRNA synthetase beta chain